MMSFVYKLFRLPTLGSAHPGSYYHDFKQASSVEDLLAVRNPHVHLSERTSRISATRARYTMQGIVLELIFFGLVFTLS